MGSCNLAMLTDERLFVDSFEGLTWTAMLTYFQNREHVKYFPLSKGAAKHLDKAERILANEFEFNNETHRLGESFDWKNNPSVDLEWLILLHKFYYLKDLAGAYDYTRDELYAQKWVSLIDSWITQVPEGFIDSQVTGRRLQQWLLSYQMFVTQGSSPSVSPIFLERFIRSINSQTQYLCDHLTPEGNHRTLELYAIFLVAVTFPELHSAHWFLEFSKHKLLENMRHDLLPDGVHRELSTDYHHTVLKNYLRFRGLALLNQIELSTACDELLKQAIEFAYYVHKPDGYIPAINDGDCNSYLPLLKKAHTYYPDEYLQYVITQGAEGKPPAQRSRGFADSGYYVLRSDWRAKPYEEAGYLFFDCGSLGFGSHGHYDALSFELAAYGHSLIVDPGRYTYSEQSIDGVNWRHFFKGTSAHNTVVVDGMDQIPYRCERPIDPEPITTFKHFISTKGFDYLHGQVSSHQYPVVHERMIFFMLPEYWIVTDLLKAEGNHNYDLYFHLAARAQDQTNLETNAQCHLIRSPNFLTAQPKTSDTSVTIEQGYVSPEYGIKHEAPVLKFSKQQVGTTVFSTVLYPFKDEPPTLQVRQLPVYLHGRLCDVSEASAMQISLTIAGTHYEDYFFINHGAPEHEYAFANISCNAQMLFLRFNQAGEVVNLQGEDVGDIKFNATDLLCDLNDLCKVSYKDKTLVLTDSLEKKGVMLFSRDVFPNSSYLSKLWGCV